MLASALANQLLELIAKHGDVATAEHRYVFSIVGSVSKRKLPVEPDRNQPEPAVIHVLKIV